MHRDGAEERRTDDFMEGIARHLVEHLERKQRGHEDVETQSILQIHRKPLIEVMALWKTFDTVMLEGVPENALKGCRPLHYFSTTPKNYEFEYASHPTSRMRMRQLPALRLPCR